jgi:hypothetical protein
VRGAGEQFDAEFPLQLAHLAAERRLGDVQALRGSGEVPLLGHGEEVTQAAQLWHASILGGGHAGTAWSQQKEVFTIGASRGKAFPM